MGRLLLFSLLLAGILWATDYIATDWIHPQIGIIGGFLFLLTVAGQAFIQWRLKTDADTLMTPYFLMMGFRLVASLIFVIIFIKSSTPDIFIFLLNFFLIYFLYVGFEIYWLVTNLRRNFR